MINNEINTRLVDFEYARNCLFVYSASTKPVDPMAFCQCIKGVGWLLELSTTSIVLTYTYQVTTIL